MVVFHDARLTRKRVKFYRFWPPAALPGAKLLKKFEQNFLLFRSESAHTLPPAAQRLRGWVRRTPAGGKELSS